MTGEPVVTGGAARTAGAGGDGRRPRVIIVAYSCGPGAGSESGVGWTWTKAASEFADVILITHTTWFRPRIEATIAALGLPITVHFVDLPRWLRILFPGRLPGMIAYCIWQAKAGRAVRNHERQQSIDVVHHLTWASDSLPSALLASRAPVRVWGPVGGVTRTARGLYRYLTLRGKASEFIRVVLSDVLRATSGTWLARHATLVVALNQDVEVRWRSGPRPVIIESNMAIEESEIAMTDAPEPLRGADGKRVALFVGRLVPLKGLVLAVQSLRYAPGWKLVVLGEGPERSRAEALAARLGVVDRLEFRGNVPRAEVLVAFRSADALLFPSFHDSSSWAVGEATSMGCPVVCLDAGGSPLQAGRNAHVVVIEPPATLPERIGVCLEGLAGRGVPEESLRAERLPGMLKTWYTGSAPGPLSDGRSTVPLVVTTEPRDDQKVTPADEERTGDRPARYR